MKRLLVHVEGQAEEGFVNGVLAPYLCRRGFSSIGARLLGNARQRGRRGGIKPWQAARGDILGHLRRDREAVATTMVDYYGLPASGRGAWPGRGKAAGQGACAKAAAVEEALAGDIACEMGGGFDRRRFLPYVAMHEFEALLFSDCGIHVNMIMLPRCITFVGNHFWTFCGESQLDPGDDLFGRCPFKLFSLPVL